MQVAVVGLGKLGLPLSLVFAKAGFEVYGVDTNKNRINQIRLQEKFAEPHVTEYLQKYGANFKLSTNYQTIKEVSTVFVIVQTPSLADGHFYLSYVEKAVRKVHSINVNALIVVSSNINIGSINHLSTIHKRICYNPEFIALGSIIHDFENPKFVLIGADIEENGKQIANTWRKVHKKPIYIVKSIEAEIIKLSLNISFTLGITFANMIGELCEKFNADSSRVLDVMYQDRRNYKVGLGFGGPCFPRDVNCFKATCMENAVESGRRLGDLLNNLNNYTLERQIQKIKSFGKKKIGFLGIAYKPNVPYTDESQPLKIARKLLEEGYEVYIYDPLAEENTKQVLSSAHFCSSASQCMQQADVLFVGTANYSNLKTTKPVVNPWK